MSSLLKLAELADEIKEVFRYLLSFRSLLVGESCQVELVSMCMQSKATFSVFYPETFSWSSDLLSNFKNKIKHASTFDFRPLQASES